ncbi:uncharacterized protein EI90DRAFT_3065026 [Cantharellus anzutake]|uniref:uncharacterized protein n=1 Tax=Cantharellus anzutake TaxID=1750568 RepID=UPI0019086253|nr:uncharacterized protein EI90DRAFT_3065026 [Cantharellus anzutake]KAF8328384.1 hypothetical protein EI90DRAFT_3065026 [Cantharellus anzutake]
MASCARYRGVRVRLFANALTNCESSFSLGKTPNKVFPCVCEFWGRIMRRARCLKAFIAPEPAALAIHIRF